MSASTFAAPCTNPFRLKAIIMSLNITKKIEFKNQCLLKTTKRRKKNAALVSVKKAAGGGLPNDLLPSLKIVVRDVNELTTPKRRVRKTEPEQVAQVVTQIKAFTFVSPITIRGDTVVDGLIRLLAAKELGMGQVPCIDISHVSEEKARMLAIALNRVAETGTWDVSELQLELCELEGEGLDLALSGFSSKELDIILLDENLDCMDAEEENIPMTSSEPVSRLGDMWLLEKHRLLCGDALDKSSYEKLLEGTKATGVLTDPPYNVKIEGNVSGLGKKKHGEFKMASGEMSRAEFRAFLRTAHQHCADHLIDGGIAYSFMDWRSIDLLMEAGREAGLTLINLPVWYKGSGGMGTFLRSAHELICQFCKGAVPKINNVELGKHGRDRTNVWVYPGANNLGSSAASALDSHPTPKNVEMCVDALLDISNKGDVVLDPFLGSGTTLIAAEKSGRQCRGIELDPGYADVCVRRWENLTGKRAVLADTGKTFDEIAIERISGSEEVD